MLLRDAAVVVHLLCQNTFRLFRSPCTGKPHNKPADVKFNTSLESFALFSAPSLLGVLDDGCLGGPSVRRRTKYQIK